jgi:hypothetical protein
MRIILLLLLALTVAGCCGRGLWYSSPNSSCDLAMPVTTALT